MKAVFDVLSEVLLRDGALGIKVTIVSRVLRTDSPQKKFPQTERVRNNRLARLDVWSVNRAGFRTRHAGEPQPTR